MKDVIVELNGARAVLLNGKGDFKIVKNRKYRAGQRLGKEDPIYRTRLMKTVAAVAAAFVLTAAFGSALALGAPYTYITMDINPSLEISLNYFDKVLEVKALNEDAERLLKKVQLKDRDLETVMDQITTQLREQDYLKTKGQNELMLTANSRDRERAEVMLQEALRTLNRSMERLQVRANIQGECIGQELWNRAKEMGVSPGKLLLCERYMNNAGNSPYDIDSLLRLTVRELMENMEKETNRIQNQASANGDNSNQAGAGQGNGYQGNGEAQPDQNGSSSSEGTELQEQTENYSENTEIREENRVEEQIQTGGDPAEPNQNGTEIGQGDNTPVNGNIGGSTEQQNRP